jgi:hypothetical protein
MRVRPANAAIDDIVDCLAEFGSGLGKIDELKSRIAFQLAANT